MKTAKIPTPPANSVVSLKLSGVWLTIRPLVPELYASFCVNRHAKVPNKSRVEVAPFPLFDLRGEETNEPYLLTYAGMLEDVTGWLDRHGYKTDLTGTTEAPLSTPQRPAITAETPQRVDESLLEFISKHSRGTIYYDDESATIDPAWLVAQVCLAWPEKTCVIATATKEEAREFAATLKNFLPGEKVTCFAGNPPERSSRVTVTTHGFLNHGAIELEQRAFYFAVEPATLVQCGELQWHQTRLSQARNARTYGLHPLSKQLSPYLQSMIFQFFSRKELCLYRHGFVERQINVRFVPSRGGKRIHPSVPIQLYRDGIWRHAVRNRRLARLASWASEGAEFDIEGAFPSLRGVKWDKYLPGPVVLLTANVEQMLQLEQRLPGTQVVCRGDLNTEGLNERQRLILAKSGGYDPKLPHRLLIATICGLQRIPKLRILIRADGGLSTPMLSNAQRLGRSANADILVIDSKDYHDPRLVKMSLQREQAYLDVAWNVQGKKPASQWTLLQTPFSREFHE